MSESRLKAIRRFWPQLIRTSPVRMALTYGLAILCGLVLFNSVIFVNASRYLEKQGDGIVSGQAQVLAAVPPERLPERIQEAERGDLRQVSHFGLFDPEGQWKAGSIRIWPPELEINGQPEALRTAGFQFGARAVGVRLTDGGQLVVAYDAKTLTGLSDIVRRVIVWSAVLVALGAIVTGIILGLGPLRRLFHVQVASAQIAGGDLSKRLPVSAAGDELDMLAELVNQMVAQIQDLLEEVRSVGDNVAHDLRAPLGSLRAYLLHCLQDWEQMDESQRLTDIERALSAADTLLARFRALQRIAALDSRQRYSGIRPCALGQLLEELAESHEALADSTNIAFNYVFDPNATVLADPELLAEAFMNLLDNAFKFTPAGGHVTWTLDVEQDKALIRLTDNGPGIDEAELSSVLQRKVRGYNTQALPGSGLGLAIVQAVVRVHGWQLKFSNRRPEPGLDICLVAPLFKTQGLTNCIGSLPSSST